MNQDTIIPEKIPFQILNKKNYIDIILYTLATFGPLGREEFINNPENGIKNRMNKNTFNKWTKFLKKNDWIEGIPNPINNKKILFKITLKGQDKLIKNLVNYKLDFRTLNEIEQKRINNFIEQIKIFFEENNIDDNNVKVEFLKLSNEITRDQLEIFSEIQFNKLKLFLTLNHPKFYDSQNINISALDFIEKHAKSDLTETDIKFFLEKVIEEDIYNIKFYKLNLDNLDYSLYFRSNSEYGLIFKAIIDNKLREISYLKYIDEKEFFYKDLENISNILISLLIDKHQLFHKDLREPLSKLLSKFFEDIKIKSLKKPISTIKEFKAVLPFLNLISPENLDGTKVIGPKVWLEEVSEKWDEVLKSRNILDFDKMIDIVNQKIISLNYEPKLISWDFFFECDIEKRNEYVQTLAKNEIASINKALSYYFLWIVKILFLRFLNKKEEIIKGYKHLLKPNLYLPFKNVIKFFYLLESENYDNALKYIEESNSKEFQNLPKSFILSLAETLISNKEIAFKLNQKMIELDPKNSGSYIKKAMLQHDLKDFKSALKTIEIAIELDPKDSKNYYIKAKIQSDLKDFENSLETIEKAIELNPKNKSYLNLKAYTLAGFHKKQDALNTIEKLVNLEPDNGNNYDTYGEILLMFKDYNEAIKKFETALNLEPKGWFIHETYIKMGKCYYKLGEYKIALDNLKKGKKLAEERHNEVWIKKANKFISEINKKLKSE